MESNAPLVRIRAVHQSSQLEFPDSPAPARVLSVHRSALNLLRDVELVTFARRSAGGLPGGIGLPDDFDPRGLGIRPGQPATIGRSSVTVAGAIRIELDGAAAWSPRLPARALPADLDRRIRLASVAAAGAGPDGLAGSASGRQAADRFRRVAAGGDAGATASAGQRLVGLGAGLTPAGDDVLVGFSAALAAGGHPAAGTLARRWADHAAGRTTLVALACHRHAAAGAYAEHLHDVLRAVLAGPAAGIEAAVRRCARVGATSGVDVLAGLIAGLDLLAAGVRRRAA